MAATTCNPIPLECKIADVFTVAELRARLGMTIAEFAAAIGCSPRSISYWENGHFPRAVYCLRMRTLAKRHGIDRQVASNSTMRYRPDLAAKWLGSPGSNWRHMRYHERAQWWNQRKRYRKILAELQSGVIDK